MPGSPGNRRIFTSANWPRPPVCFGVPHLAIGRTRERLLVGDLRLADAGFDAELALQAVDDDLEVQLAHAGDDDLARLLVGLDAERRIFLHQLLEADAELFLVALGLGLDGQRDDRLGEVHRLEHDRLVFIAQRVARDHALQAHSRRDVPGVDLLDFLTLVGVHLQEAADALGAALGRVEHARPGREHARVDAEERELTDERVGHDLERQRAERRVVGRRPLDEVRLGMLRIGLLVRVDAR